jgi:hypothetical protein
MGRRAGAANPSVDFHPNLHIGQPESLTKALAPLVKITIGIISIILVILSAGSAYWTIIGRIDRIDLQMQQQGKSLESLAGSIARLADEALTAADLRAACMQMQIANQSKGWICPFSGVTSIKPERRASTTSVLGKQ